MDIMNQSVLIIDEPKTLAALCGPNDEILKTIESLLQVRIYTKGNELTVKADDKKALFSAFVKKLVGYIEENGTLSHDTVKAVYESLVHGEDKDYDLLKKSCIPVPRGKKLFPKTVTQARYIEMMLKEDIVFGVGPAGTGKTYLAIAHALKQVLEGKKRKVVLTRPVVESGENLGFLPGDLTQKIAPYLTPLYDAMGSILPGEVLMKLEENNVIEIAPLAYMRGRSIDDSIIILDEAQNTSRSQMKMFLTRLGEGSQAIVTGDVTQIDIKKSSDSGLIHAEKILRDIRGIGFTYFKSGDVVRNALVRRIIKAYDQRANEK